VSQAGRWALCWVHADHISPWVGINNAGRVSYTVHATINDGALRSVSFVVTNTFIAVRAAVQEAVIALLDNLQTAPDWSTCLMVIAQCDWRSNDDVQTVFNVLAAARAAM
jgi:hypothetical protein